MTVTTFHPAEALRAAAECHRRACYAEAETLYRQVLAHAPNDPMALHLLGVLAADVGKPEVAVETISRALSVGPETGAAWADLGRALHALGRFDEAIHALRRSLALQPNVPEVESNLGAALQCANRPNEAITVLEEAASRNPEFPDASVNLGNALLAVGRSHEAVKLFRRALEIDPDDAGICYNLGNALWIEGKLDEAIDAGERAIQLAPGYVEAYNNQANRYKDRAQIDLALGHYRRALELAPDCATIHSNLLYALHFDPLANDSSIQAEALEWNRRHALPRESRRQPHANRPDPERRLHVGFLSPDFRQHVVGRQILPLFEERQRAVMDIVAYSNTAFGDAVTQHLHSLVDDWRDISALDDDEAAALIRADQIDILVDLSLHAECNRLPLFALKPAPLQISYLAYCGTSGMTAMDYRLSDPCLDPPEDSLACYAEKTIRLARSYWCYEPLRPTPYISALPALTNGGVTFGCLNNFAKVSVPCLDLWAKLLRSVPRSSLILHSPPGYSRRAVLKRFSAGGVKGERVTFVEKQSWEAYMQTWQRVDIALDPFPFSGGITTCDALWMGIPAITLSGKTAVGRGGCSILSNVGLPEFIANSPEDYVEIAASLAGNLEKLGRLRACLRDRLDRSPLRDAKGFARDFERALREIWRNWCAARTLDQS